MVHSVPGPQQALEDFRIRVVKTLLLINNGFAWVTPAIVVIFDIYFRHFRGLMTKNLVLLGRVQARRFRRFRQNPLFSPQALSPSQQHQWNSGVLIFAEFGLVTKSQYQKNLGGISPSSLMSEAKSPLMSVKTPCSTQIWRKPPTH